ncbi:MAG: 50S ribosomal protein L22 [Berkelbacteria bacterium GW2011_GWA2_46_7]|uniref:50S ribosomal protein L22 n=1 Tax=Berkelbacteria bacterium GW2011_GWA2_46_7 TaxID=1618335 RepID=A0A0G1SQ79_9BACT|nr:MAG: 50S ribosomal protein L22 [Berkelbacteria bacterium GW2011_GWA2_46_7]
MIKVRLNYVRHSARKLRPVLSVFVGQKLEAAIDKTSIMAQDSALMLNKTLRMARAAAEEKEFSANDMVVSQAYATEGPRIKRSRANARGRTNRYIKHLAHITVMLEERKGSKPAVATPIAPKGKVETKIRTKK